MYPRIRALLTVGTVAVAACSDSRGIAPELTGPRADLVAGTGAAALTATNSLTVGQRLTLKASNSRSRLKWTSSDSRVISVSSSGTATANAVGTATVRATGTGVSDTWYLTVNPVAVATVTSFSTAPASVTLLPGASQQFSSTATWSDGGFYPFSVTYSAQGGTISSSGLFTAGSTAGRYMVIAACLCGLSDTSYVDVASLTLTIAPKSVSLTAGQTQQFSASALWSSGATALPPLTWTTTGGSITSNGAYTAPATAGTYKVYVSHTGGTAKDSAVVTVSSTTTNAAPPPASPTSPTGVNVLFSDDFESGGLSTIQNGIRWTNVPWVVVTTDKPHNGLRSVKYRQGDSQTGGEMRFEGLANLTEVFMQYYIYQPNGNESPSLGAAIAYQGSGQNDKFFRLWGGVVTSSTISYGASTWTTDRIGYLGTEFNRNAGTFMWGTGEGGDEYAMNPKFKLMGAPEFLGRWTRVRIRCRVASSANNDGVIQIWIDDQLVADKQNLPTYAMNGVGNYFNAGYILGWANSGFVAGTNLFLDDFSISTGGFPP